MKLPSALRACCAVGAVLVLVAGCTTSSADGPTSSPASATASASVVDPNTKLPTTSPPLPTPSVIEPPTPTPTSPDPAAQEAADRAAVEQAWSQFWSVSDNLWRLPEQDRAGAASAVAIDPTLSQSVEQARVLEEEGLEAYGMQIFHPYWEESIDGRSVAVMGDCTDTSQSGAQETATGTKKTVGIPQRNTRATFVRGGDGYWRVQKIEYLVDRPCP